MMKLDDTKNGWLLGDFWRKIAERWYGGVDDETTDEMANWLHRECTPEILKLVEAEIVEARNDELAFLVRVLDEKKPWDSINPTRLQNYLKDRIKILNREKEAGRE